MPDSSGWRKHPVVLNYGVPVLSVGAVLIIGRGLDLYLRAAPVSLFICAVMFSAWLGGFRPGLLATVLSLLAFKYYFVPPIYSLAVATAEIPRLAVFSVAALFVGCLSAGQRSATEALRVSEQRFREYAETASDWLWETGPDHLFTRRSGCGARPADNRTECNVTDFAPHAPRAPRRTRRSHEPTGLVNPLVLPAPSPAGYEAQPSHGSAKEEEGGGFRHWR